MSGFRKFLMRGNVIDLAVAVIVGVAFNNVVQALISDIITPIIAAFGGQPNFAKLTFKVHNSIFYYGKFFNALLSFLIISAVVYFLLVSPVARITALAERKKEATTRSCPECLSDIPVAARRCMYCTSDIPPVTAARHAAP